MLLTVKPMIPESWITTSRGRLTRTSRRFQIEHRQDDDRGRFLEAPQHTLPFRTNYARSSQSDEGCVVWSTSWCRERADPGACVHVCVSERGRVKSDTLVIMLLSPYRVPVAGATQHRSDVLRQRGELLGKQRFSQHRHEGRQGVIRNQQIPKQVAPSICAIKREISFFKKWT